MSIAHTLSAPAPAPRWLLLGSLALNLFFIGLIAALAMREPAPSDRSASGRIERLASSLPAPDSDKLRAEFNASRSSVDGARSKYEEAREGIRAVLRREPFDNAAMREAMAKTRAARQDFDAVLQGVIAKAAGEMSPAGRAKMADWRPPQQAASR